MATYSALDNSLKKIGTSLNAAESHGLLCGLLCTTPSHASALWFQYLFADTVAEDDSLAAGEELLSQLQRDTLTQLESSNYEFNLFLPTDEEPLSVRVAAVKRWCEGLLFGVGLGKPASRHWSAPTQEFLKDAIAITRVSLDLADLEEEEIDLVEVIEYLKVGTLTLHEDLTKLATATNT